AHAYSTERRLSEAHNPSNPVIALTITDFVMFSELNTVISRFILNERDFLVDHSIYDIELIFVELPKFKKQLSELKTTVDKWLFFLNETSSILEIPENMGIVPEIKKAFDMANQANFTLSELKDQQKLEISIQNQRVTIAQAIQQGVQQRTIEIARKMLNLLEDVTISQITGLSINELEAFKASNL
ncbi:MAG: PD-(D/E)XK nuclease family transposase, partial [Pseudanabaena sp.]